MLLTGLRVFLAVLFLNSFQGRLCAQWISSNNGLYGGRINDLIAKDSDFFAASPSGVYRTSNNGLNWTPVNLGLKSTHIYCLFQSKGAIYAGTSLGVFTSSNNGATWTNGGSTLLTQVFSIVAADGVIFAGTQQGVYRSTDGGVNWSQTNAGLGNLTINSLAVSGSKVFAGTFAGLFVSADNGNSWNSTSLTNSLVISLQTNGINIYTGTSTGLYRSGDEGTTWETINSGLPPGFLVHSFAFADGNVFTGTASGVYVSKDNGTNWTPTANFTTTNVEALAAKNEILIAGTDSGIFRSLNGGISWTPANSGLANTDVRAFALNGTETIVGTFGNGISVSSNGGSSWTEKNNALGAKYVKALAFSEGRLFAGTNGGLFSSSDNGQTWVPTGLSQSINALAIKGNNIFAGTIGGGVYTSSNNGASWSAANTGLINTYVYSMVVAEESIFVGTENGVFRSINDGLNWTLVSSGLPTNSRSRVNSLSISSGKLVAATDDGVFTSSDNGTIWTKANLPDFYVNIVLAIGNNIFAGTAFGYLYISKNGGVSWRAIGTYETGWGFDLKINSMTVSASNLLVGTTKGVWSRPLEEVVRESQTINFNPIESKTLGDAPFFLTAVASSGLPVVYSVTSDKITINGNQVTMVKSGRASVTANQAGDASFAPAVSVERSFCIRPTRPTVTVTGTNTETVLLLSSAMEGNQWFKDDQPIQGAVASTLVVTEAGVYKVQSKSDDCTSEFSANYPIVITGDLSAGPGVFVFPNPVEEFFEIVGIDDELKNYQLFDLTGRKASLVLEKNIARYTGTLNHLSNGIYVLRMQVGDRVHQLKLQKK